MPLHAYDPIPPPPLNPIQDRLARGAPVPLSSHTVFHPPTTSPHSLPSTSIRPSNLPPDSWRTHAIREKAARMLDDWELLATDALEREESMPQARHRWQKVLMKGEFLTVEEERGTDPRDERSGRRGVAHRIEKRGKGKSSSARTPIEGHNHPGWVDQVSKWGPKEEELVKRCQQERQMQEQRKESWKSRKAGPVGSGGAMDVDEQDEDSNATEQEVNDVPEVIEADSDFDDDDDEVDAYGLEP